MNYKLNSLVNVILDNRGKNPSYYTNSGYPVIDNYLIDNSPYPNLANVNRYIDEYLFNNFIRCKTIKDDLILTLVGNGLGNCSLCPCNAVIIQNTIGLRFNNQVALQKYMFYCFTTKTDEIKKLNRGASQPSAKVSDVLELEFNIPPLEQQHHIVNTILSHFFF